MEEFVLEIPILLLRYGVEKHLIAESSHFFPDFFANVEKKNRQEKNVEKKNTTT